MEVRTEGGRTGQRDTNWNRTVDGTTEIRCFRTGTATNSLEINGRGDEPALVCSTLEAVALLLSLNLFFGCVLGIVRARTDVVATCDRQTVAMGLR